MLIQVELSSSKSFGLSLMLQASLDEDNVTDTGGVYGSAVNGTKLLRPEINTNCGIDRI